MTDNSSLPITWEDAKEMQDAYLANPAALKTPNGEGGYTTLKGFRVSVAAIQNIIAGLAPDGSPVQNPSTELFIFFGVCQDDIPKSAPDQCFTTILAGIDAGNQLQKQVVYDFVDPCPSNCPAS